MDEVRRVDDGELCGWVACRDDQWCAMTVFGAELGRHDRRAAAVDQVLAEGLASLAERWTLRDPRTGTDEIVCIQEASADSVTVARDYYPGPGVPTLTLSSDALAAGTWELRR